MNYKRSFLTTTLILLALSTTACQPTATSPEAPAPETTAPEATTPTPNLSYISIPKAPDEGGPRNLEVTATANLQEQPDATSNVVTTYEAGTILDNLGCEQAQETVWCDVQQLGGGPRGYVSTEFLEPAVSPDGSVATGPDDSALRAGQGEFDATGQVPCSQEAGQPTTQCDFSVARAGGGYATVVITRPDGRTRAVYFRMGIPIGVDTSEADPGGEFSTTKESDLNIISVGDERYEIPDAVVLGG